MNSNDWTNNPLLKDIDPVKLQILQSLAKEGVSKNKNEMLSFFMSAKKEARQKGITFTPEENKLLIEILMQNLSPEEKKKAEAIIKMTSTFKK